MKYIVTLRALGIFDIEADSKAEALEKVLAEVPREQGTFEVYPEEQSEMDVEENLDD